MKFILFNLNSTNKNHVNKIQLAADCYINELSLSEKMLVLMDKSQKGIAQKIKYTFLDKIIEKKICKALEGNYNKWYYILSKDFPKSKYLENKLKMLMGYKHVSASELDTNIFKYIDEHLELNNSLKPHELKVLIVADSNKSINFRLINNLIKQYKAVNIYLKETPTSYTLKRIKEINKEEGTTVDIIKKERKVFTEYQVIYFVDDKRENYPRFRLNKNSLVIDQAFIKNDKFNSNMIFINKYMEQTQLFKNDINELLSKYNKLELAEVIRKTIDKLDKSKDLG